MPGLLGVARLCAPDGHKEPHRSRRNYRRVAPKWLTNATVVVDNLGMIRRYSAILISAWAFCGMPNLCVAGVLEHQCTPEDERCPTSEDPDCTHEKPDCPHDGGCSHESDCASDPCSMTVADRGRSDDTGTLLSIQPVALLLFVDDQPFTPSVVELTQELVALGLQIPIHPSEVPFLI